MSNHQIKLTAKQELSAKTIKRLFRFDGERYFWNPRPVSDFINERAAKIWNTQNAGAEVMNGSVNSSGYKRVGINGKVYFAHRIIWVWHKGEWPVHSIDHIDGNPKNNDISNLRAVSHQENLKNQRKPIHNTSGVTGVYLCKPSNKWYAKIQVSGRLMHLGYFHRFNDAVAARKLAEIKYGFHVNHGRTANTAAKPINLFLAG